MSSIPATSEELHQAIEAIIRKRALEASEMPYDRKVWIGAVSEARRIIARIAVFEPVLAYHQAVVAALSEASETYNDADGEHTNGSGGVGNVLYDVMGLLPLRK